MHKGGIKQQQFIASDLFIYSFSPPFLRNIKYMIHKILTDKIHYTSNMAYVMDVFNIEQTRMFTIILMLLKS